MENRKLLTTQNLKEIYEISRGTILSLERKRGSFHDNLAM
ncbi:hypothetical protein CSE_00090 [Caldisericum exile AZM16c01]|uniref:Uncharacterized protein n=1 Tax=Caldisericum exile (strain DSM 21853 / NBRC 104410 / AZM16c01) TaxID=511051 RepID=A0A7U6JFH6_CALEA|nr:hypothetical protein CSE_00090 [Caldisericum exile AZM16c01]